MLMRVKIRKNFSLIFFAHASMIFWVVISRYFDLEGEVIRKKKF